MITAGADGKLKLWNMSSKDCVEIDNLKEETNKKNGYTAMSLAGNSGLIATGSRDNKVRLWSLREKSLIHTFENVQECT